VTQPIVPHHFREGGVLVKKSDDLEEGKLPKGVNYI